MARLGVLVLAILLALSSVAGAAEFVADLTITEDLKVVPARLLVSGARHRIEFDDPDGPRSVLIVDPAADRVLLLVPRYECWLEGTTSERRLTYRDPFLALDAMKKHYEARDAGVEEIAGRRCLRREYVSGDTLVVTEWFSEDLGIPLKIRLNRPQEYRTVAANVREQPVPDDLFSPPEGWEKTTPEALYERVKADPEMTAKQKEWERTRRTRARFDRSLEPGAEIRLLLGDVERVTATARSGEGRWYLIPCGRGEEAAEPAEHSHGPREEVDLASDEVPEVVVLGATEGRTYVMLQLIGHAPMILARRETSWRDRIGGQSWTPDRAALRVVVTFTADDAEEAGGALGTFSITRGKGADRKTEKVEVRLGAGEAKTFTFTATDAVSGLDYNFTSGRVKIDVLTEFRPEAEQGPF